MTAYDKYVFILCLIVFLLLTVVFSSMIIMLTKQSLRLIRAGTEDNRIYREHLKKVRRGKKKTGWFSKTITALFACVVCGVFGFTIYLQVTEHDRTANIPSLHVVYSDSMSDKHKKNEYLLENNLNDQFSRFDLIVTYELPKEEDLKLYDIVVYEVDNVLLVHRIVEIEEPNDKHPNERYFRLQGDFVENPDKFPVRYEQMKSIYRGKNIPFLGSFVMFLQSPAGYMCFILILIEMITSPLIKKSLERAEKTRLYTIKSEQGANITDPETTVYGESGTNNIILINSNGYGIFY